MKIDVLFAVTILMLVLIVIFFCVNKKFETLQKLLDKLNATSREILSGLRVIKAFNKQNYETEKFKNSNYDLITTQLKHGIWNSALSPLISSSLIL